MRTLILILIVVSTNVFGQKPSKANEFIVAYAEKNLGKKVGDGVCRTLTNEAIFAFRSEKNKNTKKVDFGGTVPGLKVKDLFNSLPGDIVGFENVIVNDTDAVRNIPSHIGIVKSIDKEKIVFYNQNVLIAGQTTKKHSKVQVDTIFFNNVVCGKIYSCRIY